MTYRELFALLSEGASRPIGNTGGGVGYYLALEDNSAELQLSLWEYPIANWRPRDWREFFCMMNLLGHLACAVSQVSNLLDALRQINPRRHESLSIGIDLARGVAKYDDDRVRSAEFIYLSLGADEWYKEFAAKLRDALGRYRTSLASWTRASQEEEAQCA